MKTEVYYNGYVPKRLKDKYAYYVDRSNSEIMRKIVKAYTRDLNLDIIEELHCYQYHLSHKEAFLVFFDRRSGAVYHSLDGKYMDTYTIIKMTKHQPLMTVS